MGTTSQSPSSTPLVAELGAAPAGTVPAIRPTTARRALSAAVGITLATAALLGLAATAASASPVPGSTNGNLGVYTIPSTPPTTVSGEAVLPSTPGALGAAAIVAVHNPQYADEMDLTIPNGSIALGTQVNTSWLVNGATQQEWYFQLVGTVLVTNASSLPVNVPVYRIINYNGNYPGYHTCLEGGMFGQTPTAGSVAESDMCNAWGTNEANQLWVVGTASQDLPIVGGSPGYETTDIFTNYQWNAPPGPAVVENVASLEAHGWYTTLAPVLGAVANAPGSLSPVTVASQTFPVSIENAMWDLVDLAPPPSSSGSSSSCIGFGCLFNGL